MAEPLATAPPSAGPGPGPRMGRSDAWLLVAVAAVLLLAATGLVVGGQQIPLAEVGAHLTTDDGSSNAYIVRELRFPRTVLGLLVGAALGGAGVLMQALTRNPLADPGLLGIELGASAAVVAAIAFFGVTSAGGYVWFALLGAALAAVVVQALGAVGRGTTPERVVLAGAALTATLGAFVSTMLILEPAAFDEFRFWVIGSLVGRGLDVAIDVAPLAAVGFAVALSLGRALNALALGEEAGRALGVPVGLVRAAGVLGVTLLCGTATAAVGPIGFVGLAVPHAARMIVGPDHRRLLPWSIVLGAGLVVAADIVGRVVVAPGELEAGIVMAFIGAPVFIALCRRRRLAQL